MAERERQIQGGSTKTHCPFLERMDRRCILPRLTGVLVEEFLYYCGTYPAACPLYRTIEEECRPKAPAVASAGAGRLPEAERASHG